MIGKRGRVVIAGQKPKGPNITEPPIAANKGITIKIKRQLRMSIKNVNIVNILFQYYLITMFL